MSTRRQHINEMRYALAHGISLPEAKRRLARQRQIAAEELLERLQSCGTDARDEVIGSSRSAKIDPLINGDAPWIMRD